jgi:hypothetical protein
MHYPDLYQMVIAVIKKDAENDASEFEDWSDLDCPECHGSGQYKYGTCLCIRNKIAKKLIDNFELQRKQAFGNFDKELPKYAKPNNNFITISHPRY